MLSGLHFVTVSLPLRVLHYFEIATEMVGVHSYLLLVSLHSIGTLLFVPFVCLPRVKPLCESYRAARPITCFYLLVIPVNLLSMFTPFGI